MESITKHDITYKILLKKSTDPKEFVWATSKCKNEVECIGNTKTVDGKSILGVLSLNLSEPIFVVFHDVYGTEDYLKEVERWVID